MTAPIPPEWAQQYAALIKAKGYRNMGVTFSPDGEYTSSLDVLKPIPADPPPDESKP